MPSTLDDETRKYMIVGGFAVLAIGTYFAFKGHRDPPKIIGIIPTTMQNTQIQPLIVQGSGFVQGSVLVFSIRGQTWTIPTQALTIQGESQITAPMVAISLPAGFNQIPADLSIQVSNQNGISNPFVLHIV